MGKPSTASEPEVDPSWDVKTLPVELIEKLSAQEYFGLFAELMKRNPPHANDYPIVRRMARLGIEPGKSFTLTIVVYLIVQYGDILPCPDSVTMVDSGQVLPVSLAWLLIA
jgi:hypothetical protein